MSFDLIIQARFNSTRLRGKVFLTIGKRKNSLDLIVDSIRKVKEIKKIILAVPDDYFSDIFEEYAKNKKIHFYKSKKIEENNLLKRFFLAAEAFKSKKIIRITSDCPFINFYSVISMIKKFKEKNLEFLTNNKPRFVPHGFDCEIFTYGMLKKIYHNAKKKYDKEHVTPWFYDNLFKKKK
jgi:spore coat polysaccharide biosynthesis protein SpsF